MENIIEIQELSFSYPDKQIFKDLNINIKKGSFTTILGPNGIGKTTLIKLLTGKQNANTFIMIDEYPIIKENYNLIEDKIGIVTELPKEKEKTVYQYLKETNPNKETKIKTITKQLKLEEKTKINQLDEEKQTMVEFAKAFIKNPKIIIIDNLLENLNQTNKKIILNKLKAYHKKGTTIINATNNIEDSLLSEQLILLSYNGIFIGNTEQILQTEEIFNYCELKTPFITELSYKLKFYNLIDKTYYNQKELLEDLWK